MMITQVVYPYKSTTYKLLPSLQVQNDIVTELYHFPLDRHPNNTYNIPMFLKESSVKRADGKIVTYLHLVESQWVKEKKRPTHKLIYSFGKVTELNKDRIQTLARNLLSYINQDISSLDMDSEIEWSRPYGTSYLVLELAKSLRITQVLRSNLRKTKISSPVDLAILGMVINRCINPLSKLKVDEWLKEDIYFPGAEDISLQHLYRGLDFLESSKDLLEDELFWQTRNLFNREVDIVFYDTTSTYIEGRGDDPCFQFGYSRDHRPDRKQVVIGLATDRDGLPLASFLFPGSTMDVTTVKTMIERLSKLKVGRVIFVCDRGMVFEDNLKLLESQGYDYLVGVKLRGLKVVRERVLSSRGRYQKVLENLEVKEVFIEGRRYIVCHNPEEAKRDKLIREEILKELTLEIERINTNSLSPCTVLNSSIKKRFVKELNSGRLTLNKTKVREDARYDGKYVLLTTESKLSVGELALQYKNLFRVERAFRGLKNIIDLRPLYHWKEYRVKAHLSLCVLSYFIQRYAELKTAQQWDTIQRHLNRIVATKIFLKNGTVIKRNQLTTFQKNLLNQLNIKEPPLILGG